MGCKWRKTKIGDMIIFNPKLPLPKGSVAKKIAMEHLLPFSKYITKFELSSYAGGAKFMNGDTLLARITPCLENGKTSQVTMLDENEIGFGSTEFIVLRAKDGVSDKDFIYYLATSPQFRDYAIKSMVGSSGRQRVQQDVLENMYIDYPSIQEQKAIAAVFSALDDKIELNNRINRNLEAQAQAIFKSWFVDFEPFRDGEFVDSELGLIPKGWRVGHLGEFFPVKTGKKNANVSVQDGAYPFFSCSQNITYCNEFSFDGNAILLSGNGDFNVKTYKGKFEAYQRTYVLIPYEEELVGFLFYLIKHQLIKITSGYRGSVIKFITKSMIEDFSIPLPLNLKCIPAVQVLQAILINISNNNFENAKLSLVRDTLLPKLMSGEIRVPLEV